MPKYKISRSNLKEFFGFFGKKNKPKDIQRLIDNDPELQAIDKRLEKINQKYKDDPRVKKYDDMVRKLGL